MDTDNAGSKKPSTGGKGRSLWRMLLWWRLDQDELNRQIAEYHSLKITQSARGQSLLLLIFSACVTTLLIAFFSWSTDAFFDVFLALFLGYFIYKGHKWAIIGAMAYWSLAKAYLVFDGFQTSPGKSSPSPIIHLVWWAIYMSPFYLAYKVEQARDKEKQSHELIEVTTGSKVGDLDKLEKLAELKDKGIITEEEFITKKKQILDL